MLPLVNRVVWLALLAGGVALAAAALLLIARPSRALAGTELNNPVLLSGLGLIDHEGREVELAGDFAGNVTFVFFGYTRCPDVCPLTMARLAKAFEAAGEPNDIRVAMVTVDPGFDTPEVLRDYVGQFNEAFIGLTGSNGQVAEAARAFFVGFAGNAPAMSHTDTVAVLDRSGQMRYIYGQDAVIRIGDDLEALRRLL